MSFSLQLGFDSVTLGWPALTDDESSESIKIDAMFGGDLAAGHTHEIIDLDGWPIVFGGMATDGMGRRDMEIWLTWLSRCGGGVGGVGGVGGIGGLGCHSVMIMDAGVEGKARVHNEILLGVD